MLLDFSTSSSLTFFLGYIPVCCTRFQHWLRSASFAIVYLQAVRPFNNVLTCAELGCRVCDLGVHFSLGTGKLRNCLTKSGVVRSSDPCRHAARNCEDVVMHCFSCTDMLYEHSTTHPVCCTFFPQFPVLPVPSVTEKWPHRTDVRLPNSTIYRHAAHTYTNTQ